jgi:hypothetical protein
MPVETPPIPVLEYSSPDAQDAIPHIGAMRLWRRIAGWGFWLSIPGLVFYLPLAVVAVAVLCVGSIGALVCMTRAGANEVGTGYAVRHLLLALLLIPILFLGVFLVTRLVESDLVGWRLAARPPA